MVEEPTNNKTSDVEENDLPSIGQLEQRMVAHREDWAAIDKLIDNYFREKIDATQEAIEALKKAEEAKRKDPNHICFELPKPKDNPGPCHWLNRKLVDTELEGHIRGLRIEFKEDKIVYDFSLINPAKHETLLKWFDWTKNTSTNHRKAQGGS
ncbi:MAG: hypothetical protein QXE05_07590 [Nitrososphaeria archaeon]